MGFKAKVKNIFSKITNNLTATMKIFMVVLLIPVVISFLMPFWSFNANLAFKSKIAYMNQKTELIPSDSKIIQYSISDMLTHKDIKEYEIFGRRISEYKLADIEVYDLIANTIPNYNNQINASLNDNVVYILSDENFHNRLKQEYGGFINLFLDNMRTSVLQYPNIDETTKQTIDSLDQASTNISQELKDMNSKKTIISWVFYIIPIAIILAIGLFLIRKKSNLVPAIVLSVLCSLIVIFGIIVVVQNYQISSSIDSAISQALEANSNIKSIFNSVNIDFQAYGACGSGYYILLIAVALMTFISYFMPLYRKHIDKKEALALQASQNSENSEKISVLENDEKTLEDGQESSGKTEAFQNDQSNDYNNEEDFKTE